MAPSELPADYPRLGHWVWHDVTVSDEARPVFTRGMRWMYTFNHEEALRCFVDALKLDPQCCMALWGCAVCCGPSYNLPWRLCRPDALVHAHNHAQKAVAVAEKHGADFEKRLCRAIAARHPSKDGPGTPEEMQGWSEAYAEDMVSFARSYRNGEDVDVLSIAAEACMGVTPWKLWNLVTAEPMPAPARTLEAQQLLETAMRVVKERGLPHHTGVLHFYIHTMEMSPTPEKALPCYDTLVSGICPDAGHLLHMGTHIGILCGEYQKAIVHNTQGTEADHRYFKHRGTTKCMYSMYALHNYHFITYGAMFSGDYKAALGAADGIRAVMTQELLAWGGMHRFGDTYCAVRYHVMVRFGKWAEILAEPILENDELNIYQIATLHYARALAFALGSEDHAAAQAEIEAFEAAYQRVPKGNLRMLHNNIGTDLLDVAREMVVGEVAFRRGEHDAGLAHLRRAVEMEDALPYDEPWGVMQPTRHALGALLLEAGRAEEALVVYHEDLGVSGSRSRVSVHVDNVWAMLGVVDACKVLGRPVEGSLRTRLNIRLARADPSIKASCFCRVSVARDSCCS